MICGNCGADNREDSEYCFACGHDLSSRLKVRQTVCANHPGRIATGVCVICGLELCEECERYEDSLIYCEDCIARPVEVEDEVEIPEEYVCREPEYHPEEPVILETFAGFEWRTMAAFLDWVVFWGGMLALNLVMMVASRELLLPFKPNNPYFIIYWLMVSSWAFAYSVGPITVWGQTPGMAHVNLKVLRSDGGKVGFGRAVIRFAAFLLSVVSVVGLFLPLRDTKRRMLHDIIAKTIVVKMEVMD